MLRQLAKRIRPSAVVGRETHQEYQYIQLIQDIHKYGNVQEGRNGTTKQIFGASMIFSLENQFPLLTTKKVAWKTCLKELLWFLRGSTDNTELQKQNVHIWDANATREFLDSRGLTQNEENDLGPIYGYQWRNFNQPYDNICKSRANDEHVHKSTNNIDQLQEIVETLKDPTKRHSRRMILTAWNPCQLSEMALPPCHVMCQFHVEGNKLSCALFQRSADVGLGMPFNIASYSFLTYLLAHQCGLQPHEFVYFVGNAHIYKEHEETLLQQSLRTPLPFPILTVDPASSRNFDEYQVNDFYLQKYQHKGVLRMPMIA